MVQESLLGQGLLTIEASRSHSDTPHSVGLLWTSDQTNAETSTWQHTALTRERQRHPCPWRDSNPQFQQASGCRPTPSTVQPARSCICTLSPNSIRVIKSRRMIWVGHVARMGEGRGAHRVLVGKPEGTRRLRRCRLRWEDNSKMDLLEVG